MSRNIGEVRVSVLPDGTRFRPEAIADLKKAVANMQARIPLEAMSEKFKAQAEKAVREVGALKATVKIDGDAKPLDAKIAEVAARSEALQKSLANLKVKDDNGLFQAMAKQAQDLRSKIDGIGDSQGLERAASQLQKIIDVSDKARTALGKTTFAEEEVSKAADKAAVSARKWAADVSQGTNAASASMKHFASEVAKSSAIKDDVKIKVKLDDTLAESEAAALRVKLDAIKANAHVGLDDKGVEAKATGLRAKIDAILHTATIRVKVDEKSTASVSDYFKNRFARDLEKDGGDAGNGFGKGFIAKLGKSALFQNPGITAVVVAGLAALPAAMGAVAALGGIALGGGLVAIAVKTINTDLKNAETKLKAATTKLAQDLKSGASKAVIQQDKETVNSLNAQIALLQKEAAAFAPVTHALSNLKQSFLQFAIVVSKPLIKPFTDALNLLSRQLSGPLRSSFTNLFKAVGPLIKPVVTALLEIVQGILPGMTTLLNKARGPITNMFLGFGKIVGLRLGQWFKDAIPYMQQSVKYFLGLINALGIAGSYLIKFGGETAKAFSDPALKGFGPIIERIANDLIKMVRPAFEGWAGVMAPVTKALAGIVVPLLTLLADNPKIVKAIAAFTAAWLIASKAIKIVNIALRALSIAELGNPWIAIAAAVILAAVLIVKHWSTIKAFFSKLWTDIKLVFDIAWAGIKIALLTGTRNAFNVFAGFVQHILDGASRAFGWVPGIGGKLKGAADSFRNWSGSVNGSFNKTIGATQRQIHVWEQMLSGAKSGQAQISAYTTKIVGDFNSQGRAAGSAKGALDRYTSAIRNNGANSDAARKARILLYNDLVAAGVKSNVAKADINNYTNAVKHHSETSDQVRSARQRLISDILTATRNSVAGKADLDRFTAAVRSHSANADQVRSARQRLIKDLISTGLNAKTATGLVDGLATSMKNPASSATDKLHGKMKTLGDYLGGTLPGNVYQTAKALGSLTQTYNSIAGALNVQHVPSPSGNFAAFIGHATPIRRARGGHIPGYSPGRDTVPAMLSPGEYVINPVAARMIGKDNLDKLNGVQQFASGGQVVADITKWKGHPYRWGGAANPQQGWDCSSFVNYILGHDFHLPLPGGAKWSAGSHGPVAAQFAHWPAVPYSKMSPGDLYVERNGQHVGFVTGPGTGFAAIGRAFGTNFQHVPNSIYTIHAIPGISAAAGGVGGLTGAQQKQYNAAQALYSRVLKTNETGPFAAIENKMFHNVAGKLSAKLTAGYNALQAAMVAAGAFGGNPAGGATGNRLANAIEGYQYLKANLFRGSKVAAAGAVASIDGESAWNPFAQGTGGRGLIGWTPPGKISNAAFKGGMRTQLPAIIKFVNDNADGLAILAMTQQKSVLGAANIWGRKVERFGINDVHPAGIALATSIMNRFARGGMVPGGAKVFDRGGTLAPGINTVYNLTGKPEHVRPVNSGSGNETITLEVVGGGGGEFETFMLTLIRRFVRVKGGGNAQKAFGRLS